MRKATWIAARLLLVAAAVPQPAQANCGNLRIISSLTTNGSSYVITPGFETGGGFNGSTVGAALVGEFWHLGNGDATIGLGNDNGSLSALHVGPAQPGFLHPYPQGAYIRTAWSDAGVDGCIDDPLPDATAERCMALQLGDVDAYGSPVFVLLSASADPGLNYYFDQPGNTPIQLAPLPSVEIFASRRAGNGIIEVGVRGPSAPELEPNLYLDTEGDCAGTDVESLIAGYLMRKLVQSRHLEPPTDFSTGAWPAVGTGILPLGAESYVAVPCDQEDIAIWLAYSLVLDSGLESPHVSPPTVRIECGPNFADPEPGQRIRRPSGERRKDERLP